jgi:hypothetical protein
LAREDRAFVAGDARIGDDAKMRERAEAERPKSALLLAVKNLFFVEADLL